MSAIIAGETPPKAAQTVVRALEVLDLLRRSGRDVRLTDVSTALTLHVSTTHRILQALTDAGYVVRSDDSRTYRLGHKAHLLGRAAERALHLDAVALLLAELRDSTCESVNLVVRNGDHGLVILRYDSPHPLRFTQSTGTRLPLHRTSTGKVLMAFAADPAADVCAHMAPEAPTHTSTARALLAELARVRCSGYAVNRGERIKGVCGIAAPVLSASGTVRAAVAVQGPQARIPPARVERLSAAVMHTASAVARTLPRGYQI